MTNTVEIVVEGKNDATRVFVEVESQARTSARRAEAEWSKSASGSSTSVAKFGTAAEKAGQKAEKGLSGGAKRGGKKADDEMSRLASRTNQVFDTMKFAGLQFGLPAAAAAGVAGAAATLAAVPALFIAGSAALLAGNERIANSFTGLGTDAKNELTAMASVMVGPALHASDTLRAGFERLKPSIGTAMTASAGYVNAFTDDVVSLAENAMPGLVRITQTAGPAVAGFGSFVRQSGAGVSDMLFNISRGSADAGAGMIVLGGTMRNLLGFAGNLVANLAANHQELGLLDTALTQVEHGVLQLTAAGSGAVGFLHGFGAAGTGALTVLNAVATALSAIPAEVTQFGGSFLASSMILKKFGIDATASFDGIGGRIKSAAKESGLFKATMSELSSAALSPAMLATAGLSVVLWGLGEAQAKAAARAQEHKNSVSELTDAIRKDKGVIDEASLSTISHALTAKNAAANLDVAGLSFARATVAASGNADAMGEVTSRTNEWIQSAAVRAGVAQKDIDVVKSANELLLQQGGAYSELNPVMQAAGKSQDQINEANQAFANVLGRLGPAQANQLVQLLNGTGAVGEQARAVREATDAYQLQEEGLTGLSQKQLEARDNTAAHTQAIYDQVNASLGLRGAQANSKQALDDYNKSLKSGNEDDKAQKLLRLEQSWQAELAAVQKSTTEHSTATSEAGKAAEGLAAMNRRAVEMADTFRGQVPASLQETIGKMSVTEARAAGVEVAIDGTGRAVYRLPNGKTINIETDADAEAAKLDYFQRKINLLHGKTVTVVTSFVDVVSPARALGRASAFAAGGNIGHAAGGGGRSGLTWVGEQGPELVKLPVGSHVNPAGASSRSAAARGGAGDSGTVVRLSVDLSGGDQHLLDWFKNRIRVEGGDVQLVLGVN
jgi:hypothetical protein